MPIDAYGDLVDSQGNVIATSTDIAGGWAGGPSHMSSDWWGAGGPQQPGASNPAPATTPAPTRPGGSAGAPPAGAGYQQLNPFRMEDFTGAYQAALRNMGVRPENYLTQGGLRKYLMDSDVENAYWSWILDRAQRGGSLATSADLESFLGQRIPLKLQGVSRDAGAPARDFGYLGNLSNRLLGKSNMQGSEAVLAGILDAALGGTAEDTEDYSPFVNLLMSISSNVAPMGLVNRYVRPMVTSRVQEALRTTGNQADRQRLLLGPDSDIRRFLGV